MAVPDGVKSHIEGLVRTFLTQGVSTQVSGKNHKVASKRKIQVSAVGGSFVVTLLYFSLSLLSLYL